MATQTARQIIDARGGYKAVAEALSAPGRPMPLTTVHSWWRGNKLPSWREEAVLALPTEPASTPKRQRRAA